MRKSKNNIVEVMAIAGGILGLLISAYNQNKLIAENPDKRFDYKSLIISGILGSLVGGVSAAFIKFISSVFDTKDELLNSKDEIGYLASVLGSYEPDDIDEIVFRKGKYIKSEIYRKFYNDLLGRPQYQGSVAQGTSLSGLSDLDILVKFKKTSYHNSEMMYESLYKFLRNDFEDTDLIQVRRQKVSIGLIFKIKGHKECIDIVPVLRTDFVRGKNEYNLFANPKLIDVPNEIKMNPYKQLDYGVNEQEKKEVVSLIKVMKETQNLPIKSILVKELTKLAFNRNKIPKSINEQLVMTLRFIRNKIRTIKVKSPDNPNSILSDLISSDEKEIIYLTLDDIIKDIDDNKDNLQEYFPIRN
jgi:hypothetical protein